MVERYQGDIDIYSHEYKFYPPSVHSLEQRENESYSQFELRKKKTKEQRVTYFRNYIIAYIIIAFLTFGWHWNHYAKNAEALYYGVSVANGIVAGIFWPIYIAGNFAIFITQWP